MMKQAENLTNEMLTLTPGAKFITRYTPWVLFALPMLFSEIIGWIFGVFGEMLINQYLLRAHFEAKGMEYFAIMEVVFIAYCIYWLWPVFKVNPAWRDRNLEHKDESKKKEIDPDLLKKARTRIYNFPGLLVGLLYFVLGGGTLLKYIFTGEFYLAFAIVSVIIVALNAMIVYYAGDLLNRFYFFPYWFPDGNIRVSYKFRGRPMLFWRFVDLFFVVGFLPVVSICGVVALTVYYGSHDADELWRVLVTSMIVGGMFWVFGFLMTMFTARTFVGPLVQMESATRKLGNEEYETRIPVQSDDQLGRLQRAVNTMGRELSEKNTIKTLFGHYVSPVVRDLILEGKINTSGDRLEAAVLFSDIQSFTTLSEKHDPQKVVQMLNLHFSRIVEIVSSHSGFVDKFIGDAVMAVFDAEFCEGRHRERALTAALDILRGLERTNEEIQALGMEPINIGIGIACGDVIRGNVGSENRRELTVVGDTVNIASRLEAVTRQVGHPLVMTRDSLSEERGETPGFHIIELQPVSLKGKTRTVEVIGLSRSPGQTP